MFVFSLVTLLTADQITTFTGEGFVSPPAPSKYSGLFDLPLVRLATLSLSLYGLDNKLKTKFGLKSKRYNGTEVC